MVPLRLMVLMLAVVQYASADSIINGTKLVFTYIVNRHGDRAPQQEALRTVANSVDMNLVEKKVAKYGYEQLTEKGKKRAYELGKFLRSRYDGLLSKTYNSSEMNVRATNYSRTMETLRQEMAGLYASQSSVSNNTVIRQRVPNSIINDTYDVLEFFTKCPPFSIYQQNSFNYSHPSISVKYPNLLKKLSNITGLNVTSRPLLVYPMYDAYLSLQNIRYKLKPEIEALLPEMRNASGEAIDILLGQHKLLPLEAGVLLNDFFTIAAKVSKRNTTEKMRLNSAHDLNVYAMQMVSEAIPTQEVPYYCSMFALELRRVIKTGQLVVLLVYLPKPGEPVKYLRVRGCGGYLCDYNTFKGIARGNSITRVQFNSQCYANGTIS